jgi:chaperonin cofactor prefoldin
MIQQFKKEVEKITEDEKMSEYRGKAFGEKYADEWFRIFSEHFAVDEVYEDEDLMTCFEEKMRLEGNYEALAHDFVVEQFDNGDWTLEHLINPDNEDQKAQLVAFVQGNFYVEEVFPRERDIDGTINEERWSKPQFKPYSETNPEDSISYKEGDDLKIGKTITEIMENLRSSGEVSRQVETLEAQNARLVAENQRLQQQLQAIKSLLHAN